MTDVREVRSVGLMRRSVRTKYIESANQLIVFLVGNEKKIVNMKTYEMF